MSERTKDWLKGSFSGWAAAVLLAVFSYLGKELHHDVKNLQATIINDRQKSAEVSAALNQEISLLKYKLDLLTRSFGDFKRGAVTP